MSGTKSGLLQKSKVSELEKMRIESDARLKRAIQHSIARKVQSHLKMY